MAVCEIWDVKGRLDHPIDYAENPEKTANPKYSESDLQAMVDVMEYATNKDKIEQRFFVSGVNCDPATARDEMMIAKHQWNDTSEIVCYHGFQSFKAGEVTPEVAHEVGVKLAEKMWGGRFQVIVATHLNTECLHNHFVVNSVSFTDGKHLQPIGMLVVLDSILNRITQNRAKGRNTFIFIDEIYLLFQHEYSANFLFTLWKRVRKYGAYCTGITQNVDDLLQSHTARTMLANSEFIIMLNQASTDRIELAKLLNISDLQMSYITNVGAGQGLLKVGSSLVPFVNKFPRNTELYKLMTTKFGEV